MTLNPKQSVAGCGILAIRDFLRRHFHTHFTVSSLCSVLGIATSRASEIAKWLEAEKYIQLVHPSGEDWTITRLGGVFANASAKHRIKRATADRLLEALIKRATQVNRKHMFAYRVARITVLGSYLASTPDLGDLDIAVELCPAEEDSEQQRVLEDRRRAVAYTAGRRLDTLVAQEFWPRNEVLLFLKSRSTSYHFVEPDHVPSLAGPTKVVFEAYENPGRRASPSTPVGRKAAQEQASIKRVEERNVRNIKDEIVDTASQLFYQHGYHVGVDRIIAEARIAKMSFYKYFPSKADCVGAVLDRACRRMEGRLREIAADVSLAPLEQACSSFEFLGQSMNEADYLGGLIPQALVEIHDKAGTDGKMALECARRILACLTSMCVKAGLNGGGVAQQVYSAIAGAYSLQEVVGRRAVTQTVGETVIDLLHLKSATSPFTDSESQGPFF